MAIFQGIIGFFLPSQRRRRAAGGGGGAPTDPALSRVLEGVDSVLEPLDASDKFAEFIEEDLKDVFEVKGKVPGYEPGARPPLKFNVLDLVRDPAETTWEVVKAPFDPGLKDAEKLQEMMGEKFSQALEKAVWNYLLDNTFVDGGRAVIPNSAREAVDRWISI